MSSVIESTNHCHSRNYSMGETQPVKLRQIVCLRAHNTYLWNDLNLKWKRAVSWHIEMMLNSDAQVISHKIFGFLYTYCSTQFLLTTGIHNKCLSVIHWSLISSLTINGDKNGLLISHIHHGRGGSYTSWLKTRLEIIFCHWVQHELELILALPSKGWNCSCIPN